MIEDDIVWIDNFMMQTYMAKELLPFLDDMIADMEKSNRWAPAMHGNGEQSGDVRDSDIIWYSTDMPPPTHEPVLAHLKLVFDKYLEAKPWMTAGDVPSFYAYDYNICRYKPGQAYHGTHSDAATWLDNPMGQRYLTQILYLNTCEGGETNFPNQDAIIKPVAGKCITHPPWWTHCHNSSPAIDTKYALVVFYAFGPSQSPTSSSNMTVEDFIAAG